MLRKHRQIKMQIQQLLDACLFCISFWLAWTVRANSDLIAFLGLPPVSSFETYFWLYLVLILSGPLVLEAQGFYDRPMLAPRQTGIWSLFKGCVLAGVGLIMALYFFRVELARSVAVLFGAISFLLIFMKEELLRL